MGMLGQSGRPVFKPSVYQPGRHNRRLPRGLGLLLIGIALGAGGVLFLQTNYGPPRLSTEQSEQVRSELNAATLERQRMQTQIDDLQRQLEASHASAAALAEPTVPSVTTAVTQPAPAAPEPASAAAAVSSPPATPAPPAAAITEAVRGTAAAPASSAAEEPAAASASETPKPMTHKPAHHDYEEPHSQLRMTVIPMTAPTPVPAK